jgi:hypothetical protein
MYVVNKSTLVSNDDVKRMVEACQIQITRDAAPVYGLDPIGVHYTEDESVAKPGDYLIAILDNSDQQGALGWHTETSGDVIYGEVFAGPSLQNGGSVLSGPLAVSSVLSHEALETLADPHANLYATDLQGRAVAFEIADPVESEWYDITIQDGTSVTVSDFVTPAWFDPDAKPGQTFDFLGSLSAPFTIANGGYIVWTTLGQPQQSFGDESSDVRQQMKGRPHTNRLR